MHHDRFAFHNDSVSAANTELLRRIHVRRQYYRTALRIEQNKSMFSRQLCYEYRDRCGPRPNARHNYAHGSMVKCARPRAAIQIVDKFLRDSVDFLPLCDELVVEGVHCGVRGNLHWLLVAQISVYLCRLRPVGAGSRIPHCEVETHPCLISSRLDKDNRSAAWKPDSFKWLSVFDAACLVGELLESVAVRFEARKKADTEFSSRTRGGSRSRRQ